MRLFYSAILLIAFQVPLPLSGADEGSYEDQKDDLSSDPGHPYEEIDTGLVVEPDRFYWDSEADSFRDRTTGHLVDIDDYTGVITDLETNEIIDPNAPALITTEPSNTDDGGNDHGQEIDYIEDNQPTTTTDTGDNDPGSTPPTHHGPQTVQIDAICQAGDRPAKYCGESTTASKCLIQEIDFDVILDPLFNNTERSFICGANGAEMRPGNYRFQFSSTVTSAIAAPPGASSYGSSSSNSSGWGQSNTVSKLSVDSYVTAIDNFMTTECGARQLSSAQLIALGGNTYDTSNTANTTYAASKVTVAKNLQGSFEFLAGRPRFLVARAPFLVSHGASNSGEITVSVGNSRIDRGNPCTSNTNINELYFQGYTITNHDLGAQYHSDPEVLLTRVNIHGPDGSELLVGSSQIPGLQEFMQLSISDQVFYKLDPTQTLFRAPYSTWIDNTKMLQYLLAWAQKNRLANQFASLLDGLGPSYLLLAYTPATGYAPQFPEGGADQTIPASLAHVQPSEASIFEAAKQAAAKFYYRYYEFQTSYPSVYRQQGSGGAQSDAEVLAYEKLRTPLTMDPESFLLDTRNIQDKNAASILLWPIRRAEVALTGAVPEFYLPLTFEIPQVYTDVQSLGYDNERGEWTTDKITAFGAYGNLNAEFVPRVSSLQKFSLSGCFPNPVAAMMIDFVNNGLEVSGTQLPDTTSITPSVGFCLPEGALAAAASGEAMYPYPGDIFVYPREILGTASSITDIAHTRAVAGLIVKIPVKALLRGGPDRASSSVQMTVHYPVSILSQLANPPTIIPVSHTRRWTRVVPKHSFRVEGDQVTWQTNSNTVTRRDIIDTYVFYRNVNPGTGLIGCSSGGTSNFMNATKTFNMTVGLELSSMQNLSDSMGVQHTGSQSVSGGTSHSNSTTDSVTGSAGVKMGIFKANGSGGYNWGNSSSGDSDTRIGGGTNTNTNLRTAFSSNQTSSNSNSTTLTLSVPSSTKSTLSLWGLGRCAANTRIYSKHVVTKAPGHDGQVKPFYNAAQQHLLTTGRLYQTEPRNSGGVTSTGVAISGFTMQPLDHSHSCGEVISPILAGEGGGSPGQIVVSPCFYYGIGDGPSS